MSKNTIEFLYLSQEDLIHSGCLDPKLAMNAAEGAMKAYESGEILFPEKIVQIFNEDTQERINCLPATLLKHKVCGVKWVSVFPLNPSRFGRQNLSAIMVLSEIERGFPIAVMDGTLCSNLRVAAMGAVAAKYLARADSKTIGFIGSGEQAKMHLMGMKAAIPGLEECRVSAKTVEEERAFVESMQSVYPAMRFVSCNSDHETAMSDADILVTATSAQAPLLKAKWMKAGAFYSHIGGWEDEYAVAQGCDKIVCDDWEVVKHRTQTLSRMYKDGVLKDEDVYGNLTDLVTGKKPGRQSDREKTYFNAVGLSYVDVAIAYQAYSRALENGFGTPLKLQDEMIFDHKDLKNFLRRP